jgi:hypothetical protein
MPTHLDLPPTIASEVLGTLFTSLPPPVLDTVEARATRAAATMAAVAALYPADTFEASLPPSGMPSQAARRSLTERAMRRR